MRSPSDESPQPPPTWEALIADARDQVEAAPRASSATIPGYKLLREIHRGGQGVVYLAHHPATQRQVAIKILREGPFAGPGERARFEREIQLLASLKHPHIVTVHDSGSAAGNVYLVMDFIDGAAFDVWAEAVRHGRQATRKGPPSDTQPPGTHHVTQPRHVRARHSRGLLDVFLKICDAVHEAHLRGVIHRDLKPTNVRVDRENQPFVLDFGLAKSQQLGTSDEALTATGQFLGTYQWASPEQLSGLARDADLRSDVYALGLMLYQAITGNMPYPESHLLDETVRTIREGPPTPPRHYCHDLPHDLETVILKCLAKDPQRRYQTAGELAADIRRFLVWEPIAARRESGWYQLGLFARRHRAGVTVGVGLVLLLLATTIALSLLYARALRGERLASQRAEETARVAQFQEEQIRRIDPSLLGLAIREELNLAIERAAGDETSSEASTDTPWDAVLSSVNFTDLALSSLDRQVFEQTRQSIDAGFVDRPLLRARLLQSLATTQRNVGLSASAMPAQQQALTIRQEQLGKDHPDTLLSLSEFAQLQADSGELAEALSTFEDARSRLRAELGPRAADTLKVQTRLVETLNALGRPHEALPIQEETHAVQAAVLGTEHPDTLQSLGNLGSTYHLLGEFDRATGYFESCVEDARRHLGDQHALTLVAMINLGFHYRDVGRTDEALTLFQAVHDTRVERLGSLHPLTLNALDNLASALHDKAQLQDAVEKRRIALRGYIANFGHDHPQTLRCVNGLGQTLVGLGDYQQASRLLDENRERMASVLGATHTETVLALKSLAEALRGQGKAESAVPYAEQAFLAYRNSLGPDHPNTLNAAVAHASTLVATGAFADAEKILSETVERFRATLGRHPKTITAMGELGAVLLATEQWNDAKRVYEESIEGAVAILGEEHPNTVSLRVSLASTERKLGNLTEAIDGYQKGQQGFAATLGPEHPYTLVLGVYLGEAYFENNDRPQAEATLHAALERCRKILGEAHPTTLRARGNWGMWQLSEGDVEQARTTLSMAVEDARVLDASHRVRRRIEEQWKECPDPAEEPSRDEAPAG